MKILMFAGAGSVGKTSLMDACKKMAEERGLRVKTHYSTTRRTYKRHGLTGESDALKDPEFNRNFQNDVMLDNINDLYQSTAASKSNNIDLLIADRAPYDYASYQFTVFQDKLNLQTIAEKRKRCDDVMICLAQQVLSTHVILLPYPTSWAEDTESSDGWRADKTGKNFIWSSVVEAELADAKKRLANCKYLESPIYFERLPSFMERGSIGARAVGALTQVFPHLR